jgi:hypothetical protein
MRQSAVDEVKNNIRALSVLKKHREIVGETDVYPVVSP